MKDKDGIDSVEQLFSVRQSGERWKNAKQEKSGGNSESIQLLQMDDF